jgi:hypothetical protein
MPVASSFRACTPTRRRQRPGGLVSVLGTIVYGRAECLQVLIAQFILDMEFFIFMLVVHGVLLFYGGLLNPRSRFWQSAHSNSPYREGGARGSEKSINCCTVKNPRTREILNAQYLIVSQPMTLLPMISPTGFSWCRSLSALKTATATSALSCQN